MPTTDCQKSVIEGKTLGLHSTVFWESDDENTRLNNKNRGKKAEKCPQLRKTGQPNRQWPSALRAVGDHPMSKPQLCASSTHTRAAARVTLGRVFPSGGDGRVLAKVH